MKVSGMINVDNSDADRSIIAELATPGGSQSRPIKVPQIEFQQELIKRSS